MKSKFLRLIVPIFAIGFAIVSAFATTNTSNEAAFSATPGYIDAPAPCMQSINCSPAGATLCTNAQGVQAYGKFNQNDTSCPRLVYKPL